LPLGHDRFLLRHRQRVKEGLHRGFAETPTSLMWTRFVILAQPGVKIGLQVLARLVVEDDAELRRFAASFFLSFSRPDIRARTSCRSASILASWQERLGAVTFDGIEFAGAS
jgi:hypothetical protein